ncbi:MAG: hypothetical protein ACLGP3_10070, partial [Acidobacteriota bacterium]
CFLIAFRLLFSILRNMFSPAPTHTLSSRTERSAVKDPQFFRNPGERQTSPQGTRSQSEPRAPKFFPLKRVQISSLLSNACRGGAAATRLESNTSSHT